MSIIKDKLDSLAVGRELFVAYELLGEVQPDTPLGRYLEYQAYVELVRLLSVNNALPDGFGLESLEMAKVRDWIMGRVDVMGGFKEKIRQLLLVAGDKILNELCAFYCAYKKKLDAGFSAASLFLTANGVATLLAQYKLDILLFHGVPITALLSWLIMSGVLDDICECDSE